MKSWEKLDFSKLIRLIFLLAGALLSAPAFAVEKDAPKTSSQKIEELFIWKISDELKLSTKEEKSFAEIFRKLNKKKSDLSHEQDEILNRLAKSSDKNQVKRLREILAESSKLSLQEFDEVKKLVGEDRVAKYFLVKRDLTNKVKTLLAEKSEKKDADLPPPKVIEE